MFIVTFDVLINNRNVQHEMLPPLMMQDILEEVSKSYI